MDTTRGPATEQDVGIVEFATMSDPVKGTLRHRWRDFQVHEIDSTGNMAVLTDVEPICPMPMPHKHVCKAVDLTEDSILKLADEFTAIAGSVCGGLLKAFLEAVVAGEAAGKAPDPLVLPEEPDKDKRRAVHTFLKTNLKLPPLVTDSVSVAGAADPSKKHAIRASLKAVSKQQGVDDERTWRKTRGFAGLKRSREQGGWKDWPGGPDQKYLKFVLFKENMDTHAAVGVLCRKLRVQTGTIAMAGTKDKRGVTSQFVTAFQIESERLAALNPSLRGIRVGNFQYCKKQLRLGQLQGNHFKIIMRNVRSTSPEQVEAACKQLAEKGFVNYFGLQRFGTGCVSTYKVGAALLKGKWQQAVELLMAGPPEEQPELAAARKKFLKTGQTDAALDTFPKFMVAERAVLEGLKRNGHTNFVTALLFVPRTLRMMYLHAYQSYLWNHAVSYRLATYGKDRVVTGDLVLLRSPQTTITAQDGKPATMQTKDTAIHNKETSQGSTVGQDCGVDVALEEEGGIEEAYWETAAERLNMVHMVTEEEAAARKFSILDVVLPLPGSDVQYPKNGTAKVYEEVAAKDGVSLQHSPHRVYDFSFTKLTGDYRPIIQKATDISFKLIPYSDPNDDSITSTDWEALQYSSTPYDAGISAEAREAKRLRYSRERIGEAAVSAQATVGANQKGNAGIDGTGTHVDLKLDSVAKANLDAKLDSAPAATPRVSLDSAPAAKPDAGVESVTKANNGAEERWGPVTEPGPILEAIPDPTGDARYAAKPNAVLEAKPGSPPAAATAPSEKAINPQTDAQAGAQLDLQPDAKSNQEGEKPPGATAAEAPRSLLALELQFCLPSSSYATMVLREVTKECTSKAFHRALTQAKAADVAATDGTNKSTAAAADIAVADTAATTETTTTATAADTTMAVAAAPGRDAAAGTVTADIGTAAATAVTVDTAIASITAQQQMEAPQQLLLS